MIKFENLRLHSPLLLPMTHSEHQRYPQVCLRLLPHPPPHPHPTHMLVIRSYGTHPLIVTLMIFLEEIFFCYFFLKPIAFQR